MRRRFRRKFRAVVSHLKQVPPTAFVWRVARAAGRRFVQIVRP